MTVTQDRLTLFHNDYRPIPVTSKRCVLPKWTRYCDPSIASAGVIQDWAKHYPDQISTGIVARNTPGLDIDILTDPDAADAVENMAKDAFGEHGDILIRIGQWPKRLIPLRTDEPFHKLVRVLIRDGNEAKLEVLGDGQMWVAYGIHPDTHKNYEWRGGDPLNKPRELLPYVRRDDMVAFLDAATNMLVNHYGYTLRLVSGSTRATNGAGHALGDSVTAELYQNIRDGVALHDSSRDLIARLITGGSNVEQAIADVTATFDQCPQRDARWESRRNDVRRMALQFVAKMKPPEEKPATPDKNAIRKILRSYTELKDKMFDPLKWIVPGFFPEGLTLLAGKPKVGKSWLMLATVMAVARSDSVLDQQCAQRDVLYLALEDSERRMHSRTERVIGMSEAWPGNAFSEYSMPNLDHGFLDELHALLQQRASLRNGLVIIDTLAKIRGRKPKDEEPYQFDHRTMSTLAEFAHANTASMIVVHHLRKTDSPDPFDMISGTTGLAGGADTIAVLGRAEDTLRLAIRGRDVEPLDKTVSFDSDTAAWNVTGDYESETSNSKREIILAVIRSSPSTMTPLQISEKTGLKHDYVRTTLRRLTNDGKVFRTAYGSYGVTGPAT